MRYKRSWSELKNLSNTKNLVLQYEETNTEYNIWCTEEKSIVYYCIIDKSSPATTDQQDFQDNYKAAANGPISPLSDDNKPIVRSESRPLGCTTCFIGRGDSGTNIGDGTGLRWDFEDDIGEDVSMPSGSTMKRKRIEIQFLDDIYIKEGAIYFYNAIKGTYVDLYIVCPAGQYYYDNNGNPQLAAVDTPISHYVINHWICGECPMGDELNTESCSQKIPNSYKFWLEVTVPDTDILSHGYVSLEIYRTRTMVL